MEQIIAYAVFYFCILILGTISGIFSERAGIVNIAINGFMIFGAIMYVLFGVLLTDVIFQKELGGWVQIPLTIIAVAMSALFSLLFGLATIRLKADQTISGFAINILAGGITALLVLLLIGIQNAGSSVTWKIQSLSMSEAQNKYLDIVSFKTFITIIVVAIAWFAMRKTRWGLRFRSIGENPQAADVAGINVNKIKWQAVMLAGSIAGLAGSLYAQARAQDFSITKEVDGLGFLALAIMITSRWKISLSIPMSAAFAFLLSFSVYGSGVLQSSQKYLDLFRILPYVVTLAIMVFTSKNTVGPAAAGIPYDKSKR
ncbi:ABC transporter permease [Mycoplasma sp. VS42A]|uniref:ABC transporter permease n=1 Tax=unclassified Mycoplasma TaxID=2683645 RepID=UPI003A8AF69F